MKKLTIKECPRADEIVSYIYDEIGGPEQTDFENHLADCMKCTDDFAAVSESRFSVFEWQKEEFAPLATPRIVIPYEVHAEAASWFDGLKGLLAGSLWPAAAMAAILLIVGAGLIYRLSASVETETALSNPKPAVASAPQPSVEIANNLPSKPVTGIGEKATTRASVDKIKPKTDIRPIRAADVVRGVRPNRQMTAEAISPNNEIVSPALKKMDVKAPALGSYDEDDDHSLRLADLFDDGGV